MNSEHLVLYAACYGTKDVIIGLVNRHCDPIGNPSLNLTDPGHQRV
jgi:hypothetical protein